MTSLRCHAVLCVVDRPASRLGHLCDRRARRSLVEGEAPLGFNRLAHRERARETEEVEGYCSRLPPPLSGGPGGRRPRPQYSTLQYSTVTCYSHGLGLRAQPQMLSMGSWAARDGRLAGISIWSLAAFMVRTRRLFASQAEPKLCSAHHGTTARLAAPRHGTFASAGRAPTARNA